MDQKRLFLAIVVSIAILLGFQVLVAPHLPQPAPPPPKPAQTAQQSSPATPAEGAPGTAAPAAPAAQAVPANVPRVKIAARRLHGSISLLGARIDDVVLTDYRETQDPRSPEVRLFEPRSDPHPYYAQYGWVAPPGSDLRVPDTDNTL